MIRIDGRRAAVLLFDLRANIAGHKMRYDLDLIDDVSYAENTANFVDRFIFFILPIDGSGQRQHAVVK